jgi:hypothetical protein
MLLINKEHNMAGKLISNKTTYEFSLADIKTLIADELGVIAVKVHVEYVIEECGGDPMDRFPGVDTVTKIRVIVDQ